MADERFSHISKDPRFRAVPKKDRKVKIDQRFQSMFKDERFNYKYSLDKRGRPFQSTTNENLRRYYDLSDDSSDESEDEDEDNEKEKTSVQKNEITGSKSKSKNHISSDSEVLKTKERNNSSHKEKKLTINVEGERPTESSHLKESSDKAIKKEVSDDDADSDDDIDDEVDDDNEYEEEESGLGSGPDLARGIGNETSSSDDSDFDSQDENCLIPELGNIVHNWGEMDRDATLTSEISSRLAICNMDWENITAVDIFVVLNSFKPPQGAVLSVKIYPSEFGLKRIAEENMKGPPELAEIIKNESDIESNDSEAEEGNTFHNEKLRQYEINRMKYYYAVVECDSVDTANYIYKELDGTEYEQSRSCFDMRFIPNDMEFTETPRDTCTEMPSKDQYRPNQFVSNAMSSSTVILSWDETNRHRVEFTTKKFSKKDDILMDDFKAYLASSSEESENEEVNTVINDNDNECSAGSNSENEEESESKMSKYKMLLEAAEEDVKKKKQGNIEMEITWEPGLKEKTESILKKRNTKQNSTPWLDYLEKVKTKRKEKKSARKAAKKENSDEKSLFSDDDMPADVDLNDPYFSSELNSNANNKSKTEKKKEKKKKKHSEKGSENLTVQEIELKKQEQEELALLMADDDDDGKKKSKHHFDFEDYIEGTKSDKKKKNKKKLKQKTKIEDDFKINLSDERFKAVFTSGHYNIDKSAPDYKKSAGMEELIEEKLRRRYNERTQETTKRKGSSDTSGSSGKYSKMNTTSVSTGEQSLDSLVRSIKSKMTNLHNSKKKIK